jgi:mannitol-1-/sugar-/sorbitol-6-phosphatase
VRSFSVDAVLFDLDGTLVDSSASVARAWRRVATEVGVPIEQFEPYLHGIPAPQVFALVTPWLPGSRISQLTDRMLAEQAADIGDVAAQPGALAALANLPASRWAIVTSGDRRLAPARIGAAGLPAPRVLITTDDVVVGKPDPACYLLGAKRLGYPPDRCLVVEDAPAGIASAMAAGMTVLGVLTTYEALDGVPVSVPDLSFVDLRADRHGVHVDLRPDQAAWP